LKKALGLIGFKKCCNLLRGVVAVCFRDLIVQGDFARFLGLVEKLLLEPRIGYIYQTGDNLFVRPAANIGYPVLGYYDVRKCLVTEQ